MKNMNTEKADVVSVILEDHDLLDVFSDALKVQTAEEIEEEEFRVAIVSENSLGKLHEVKCYVWKKLKDFLKVIADKAQVLAVLAEYHLKDEVKKVRRKL